MIEINDMIREDGTLPIRSPNKIYVLVTRTRRLVNISNNICIRVYIVERDDKEYQLRLRGSDDTFFNCKTLQDCLKLCCDVIKSNPGCSLYQFDNEFEFEAFMLSGAYRIKL